MRLSPAPPLLLIETATIVLGFDALAVAASHAARVPYVVFMWPDFLVFVGLGFAIARVVPRVVPALGYIAIAALIEATAGNALATALHAEPPRPGTSWGFFALETAIVTIVTSFWGALGLAISYLTSPRR